MHRLINRIGQALVRAGRFVRDVRYYWCQQHHPFRRSLELARDTIYP